MPYKYPIHPFPIPPVPATAQPTLEDYIRDRNAATDIILLHLRPNTPIEDPSTEAGKLWTEALDAIRGSEEQGIQPQPGFGRLYWGRAEAGDSDNDDDMVLLMIDWDDLSLHTQHQSHLQTKSTLTTTLSPLLRSPDPSTSPLSVKFSTYPPLTASATSTPPYPLTALTIAKFPATMDPAELAQIPALWQYTRQDLQPRGEQRRNGCLGAVGGWVTMTESSTGVSDKVGMGLGAETGEEGGRWYVMLDVWEGEERREEWQEREEARLLRRKWEERATGGLWVWVGRLRMWKTGEGEL